MGLLHRLADLHEQIEPRRHDQPPLVAIWHQRYALDQFPTKYGRPLSVVPPSAAQHSVAEQAALKRYLLSRSGNQNPALAAWHQVVAEFAKIFGMYAAQTVREPTSLRETFVHLRGDFRRSGEKEELAPLTAIGKNTIADRRLTRLDLANWIVAPAKPLTASVAANDIWQRLFGVGLVDTPGDFGRQGDPLSHPELLDWLASQYLRCGGSRKAMIRKIVCSATYRQSSRARAELADRYRESTPRTAKLPVYRRSPTPPKRAVQPGQNISQSRENPPPSPPSR